MKPMTARRLALSGWSASIAFLVAGSVLTYLNRSALVAAQGDQIFAVLGVVAALAYGTVGALIASRHPSNAVGWAFLWITFFYAILTLSSQYAIHGVIISPGSLPGTTLAAWIQNIATGIMLAAMPVALLMFPNGRPPSPRWRPVLWVTIAAAAVATIGLAITPGEIPDRFGSAGALARNPTGLGRLGGPINTITGVAGATALVMGLISVVSLFVRYRRARGDERQQIRWLAYVMAAALTVFAVLFFGALVFGQNGDWNGLVPGILFTLFFTLLAIGIPAACGVAVLRYRLYDLDIVVKKTVVFALVAAFITLVYVVIVIAVPTVALGIGAGRGFSPLTLMTTVIVALAFQPVRNRARKLADRLVYGRRATPFEVLSEFSQRAGETYSIDDVLPRMAQLLAASTGAKEVRVWVRVGHVLTPATSWPADAPALEPIAAAGDDLPAFPQHPTAFPVRHQGEVLGALTLEMPANDPTNPSKEKLVQDLASQAGLVIRNVRLIEELRSSRRRIVTAQDERAKALERNIHDGAQQQLVALSVKLRLAQSLVTKDPEKAEEMLADLQAATTDALENLRDLARGIYPPLLADKGLAEALTAQARKSPVPTVVDAGGVERYPQEVETAVYFCCLEALQNVAKYADASSATVRLTQSNGLLTFEVRDDGRGFDPARTPPGSGLQNMTDRLEAIGGALDVRSAPGSGTVIAGRLTVNSVDTAR